MSSEFYLMKAGQGFAPATEQDREYAESYKQGEVIRVKAQKPRNGQFHRKGMALMQLTFEYWQPPLTLLTAGEQHMAQVIAERLSAIAGGSQAIIDQITLIVKGVEDARRNKIGEPEKSFNDFRKDVTIKAGFYDVVVTTTGIKKVAHSLSYDKMPQEKFNEWYKDSFKVCWQMVLSRHFPSETEAENAVNNMLEFI